MSKKRQRNYKMSTSTELDYMKVIKISVGVLLVLGIVYLLTAIASGEIKLKKDDEEEKVVTINYQEIIAGETFNRNAENYYVFFYNFEDNYADYYSYLISTYNSKDNSLPFYTVNLDKKINTDYIITDSDDSTIEYAYPSNIETLRVQNPTILEIKNGKTVNVITGKDNILEFFK